MLVERIRGEHWQCGVWDNNFMAGAKSALYVNPVGRYEQPRVTKLCSVQQPMQGSVLDKIGGIFLENKKFRGQKYLISNHKIEREVFSFWSHSRLKN